MFQCFEPCTTKRQYLTSYACGRLDIRRHELCPGRNRLIVPAPRPRESQLSSVGHKLPHHIGIIRYMLSCEFEAAVGLGRVFRRGSEYSAPGRVGSNRQRHCLERKCSCRWFVQFHGAQKSRSFPLQSVLDAEWIIRWQLGGWNIYTSYPAFSYLFSASPMHQRLRSIIIVTIFLTCPSML